ncbi:hypothetical protein KGM_212062 [Danaus plexippus plexippus]|uniref:Uncharacterized protein n=1 Tax=Danaus plexippus plexippus TaxID=278856 RepID=A0A212ER52_DANPL|nr:hypothetical protein KGM_212062 [Danaus plexippus plexippus]
MSSVSVTSSKREKETVELSQELESVRALNSSLRAYLEHLQTFRKNLNAVNENTKILSKVNSQWIETLNNMNNIN